MNSENLLEVIIPIEVNENSLKQLIYSAAFISPEIVKVEYNESAFKFSLRKIVDRKFKFPMSGRPAKKKKKKVFL